MKKNLLILVTLLLSIGQAGAEGLTVSVEGGSPQAYTGTEKVLKVEIQDGDELNPEDCEILINGQADIKLLNVGTYAISVSYDDGGGGSLLTGEYTLEIEKAAQLTSGNFEIVVPDGGFIYDGIKKEPAVNGTFNGNPFTAFTVTYGNNTTVSDEVKVTVQLEQDMRGNFENGDAEIVLDAIDILPKVLSEADFTLDPDQFTYTGSKQSLPDVTSSDLTIADDFTVSDDGFNNTTVDDGMKLKITLINENYTFKESDTEVSELIIVKEIDPVSIAGETAQGLAEEIDGDGYPFEAGGVEIEGLPEDYDIKGFSLVLGEDFEYKYTDNESVRDDAKVQIEGIGNFEGLSEVVTFKIVAAPFNVDVQTEATFTGAAIEPEVKMGEDILVVGEDYDIEITQDGGANPLTEIVNVGEYKLKITPSGGFSGEPIEDLPFEVKAADIEGVVFEIADKEYNDANEIKLTKTDITSATLGEAQVDVMDDDNYDFDESTYQNNTEAGVAKVVINGKGNLSGTQEVSFNITKALNHADIEVQIPTQYHTGQPIEPTSIIVKDKNKTLKQDQDYTFTLDDLTENTAVGKATAKVVLSGVTGGVYKGQNEIEGVEFSIVSRPATFAINLEVGDGIEVKSFSGGGELTVEDGESLILEFKSENPDAKKEDILLLVDGVETDFTFGTGNAYSRYNTGPVTNDMSIVIGMKAYTVTIPEIEGATTYPAAGDIEIKYGEPLTFTLVLEDDYDESEVVIKVNGEEVEAEPLKSSTYKIFIEKVTGPIVITVEGVKRNDDVGNTVLPGEVNIYSDNGNLIIETSSPALLKVYTVTGALKAARNITETESIPLPSGIYFIRLGNETYKVIVK